ncbi:MAG: hypothetical protein A2Z71_06950 [Chloroflexi bacterium RBG_13_50_21]|nr:MAG: hypothetical protein A2Z71_06950 [Chloroflexi bacterium RBG_13_50_21]
MEYTVEEVQPLKDDSSQSAEETNMLPSSQEDDSMQSTDETDMLSTPQEDDGVQSTEETNMLSAYQEDDSIQSTEETDILSAFQEDDSMQSTEETDILSAFLEDDSMQSTDDANMLSTSQEDDSMQSVGETDMISTSQEDSALESTVEIGSISTFPDYRETQSFEESTRVSDLPEVIVTGPAPKKIALILSGGGARGAFQVGAEKYAREVKGYHWDIIAGVSVGALNGAMLAMHRYTRLMELWDSISDPQVYTGGFNLVSLVKLMFGAKSFYGNAPLQKLMQHEFEAGRIIDDLHVGAVSLISGEYVQFTKESLELARAILASASIPVVWPPVDVAPDRTAMVDGGVRNISPVGDVLDLEPDEIVIINCSPEQPSNTPHASANVLSIGMRALDIMQNEIFVNDMKEFLRINALVKEAEEQGCFLHHPKTGRLLKYYPCQVIEPDGELGEVLDFSQNSVQAGLRAGVRRAREVLGRS